MGHVREVLEVLQKEKLYANEEKCNFVHMKLFSLGL